MFHDNGIFVDCILYFDNTIIFYLFAMLLSSITFTQHHSLFLGFAICKYIVYTVTKKMIYTYTYYLCHATSLPNVRQYHLPNLVVLLQCPTLGSTSSIVRTLHPLNTGVPGAVSMEVDMGLRHDILRICLTTNYAFQVFYLSLMILLSFMDLFVK